MKGHYVEDWTELAAMNALQDYGIISDNAVWWDDVGNQEEARKWLRAHQDELKQQYERNKQ